MEQKTFDFNCHESNPIYLQIPDECQQQLVNLMASLILSVVQPSEENQNDPSEQ